MTKDDAKEMIQLLYDRSGYLSVEDIQSIIDRIDVHPVLTPLEQLKDMQSTEVVV